MLLFHINLEESARWVISALKKLLPNKISVQESGKVVQDNMLTSISGSLAKSQAQIVSQMYSSAPLWTMR